MMMSDLGHLEEKIPKILWGTICNYWHPQSISCGYNLRYPTEPFCRHPCTSNDHSVVNRPALTRAVGVHVFAQPSLRLPRAIRLRWCLLNTNTGQTTQLRLPVKVGFHYPSWRPELTGVKKLHPSSRAVNSARELGPWTRVVETDL